MVTSRLRGFISLLLGFSFLVVTTSGLVLWLVHPGGPETGDPSILGVEKGIWKAAHINVSLLMIAVAVGHLWLNWSVFFAYVWERAAGRLNQGRELVLALAVVGLVCWVSSGQGSSARFGRVNPQDLAKKVNQSVTVIVAALQKEGLSVHDPADSFAEIAEHNGVPVAKVLTALRRQVPLAFGPREGRRH